MGPFTSYWAAVGLGALQFVLFVAGAVGLAMLFVVVWTEKALRHLLPLVIARVPQPYRKMLLRMVPPPPKCVVANSVQPAD